MALAAVFGSVIASIQKHMKNIDLAQSRVTLPPYLHKE